MVLMTLSVLLAWPMGAAAAQDVKSPANSSKAQLAALLKHAHVPLDEAVRRAVEKTPGQPVKVELQRRDEKIVWEVTVLAQGNLQQIYVDGEDGNTLTPVVRSHGEEGATR